MSVGQLFAMFGRVLLFVLSACLVNAAYVVPPATVEVLSPKGLRVSIPDSPGITLFAFHGNINEPFESLEAGQMARDVIKKRGDLWVFEDKNVRLKKGDVLYYWLYVILDGLGYQGLDRSYTVTGLESSGSDQSGPTSSCFNSPTRIKGEVQCSGNLIFEKYFTGNQVDKNTWSYEIQIGGSDLADEFVVFNNDPQNSFLSDNHLVIRPRLLESVYNETFIRQGQLVLNGCTSNNPNYCEKKAQSYLIMPPVLSARLTTKNSFSFLYGIVEIKAKLPQGNWIVPELWLQPKELTQGSKPTKIVLGLARGNKQLSCQGKDLSNKLLTAGTIYGDNIRMFEKLRSTDWSQDFHLYKVSWTPNGLIFSVDNEEIGRTGGQADGSELATFDKEFYITIGLHAGGVLEFPDSCVSGLQDKPWINSRPNRVLTFWQDRKSWFPTWNDDSALRVEYVKVWGS